MIKNTLDKIVKKSILWTGLGIAGVASCAFEPDSKPCDIQCTVELCSFDGISVLQDKFSPKIGATSIYGLEIEADSIQINKNQFTRYLHQMVRFIENDSVKIILGISPSINEGNVIISGDSITLTNNDWFRMYGTQNPSGLTLMQDSLYGVRGNDTFLLHDGNGIFEYRMACAQVPVILP